MFFRRESKSNRNSNQRLNGLKRFKTDLGYARWADDSGGEYDNAMFGVR